MNCIVFAEPPVLDQAEIEKLIAAFEDRRNAPAASLLAFAGVRTASGVLARLVFASDDEREVLHRLIYATLAEHDRLEA
jgi:hypothetical protein